MKLKFFRRAFTLMEVNLAILVMAGGILSVVTLYSLGFRENAQSAEDVAAAAYADIVLGRLAMALSDPDITWDNFNSIQTNPSNGWGDYFRANGDVISNPEGKMQQVFSSVMSKLTASGVNTTLPALPDCLDATGLVVRHDSNSSVVQISFRAARSSRTLMSSPMYFTAVNFQGKLSDSQYKNGGSGE